MVHFIGSLLSLLLPLAVIGQISVPTCNPITQFNWAFNSLGQSPCLVAGNLKAVCSPGGVEIDPITTSEEYFGPNLGEQNSCVCSSVYYSLLSACAACQGAEIRSWSLWIANCSSSSLRAFPENIPSGTAVPNWAYMDVTSGNSFNVTLAKQIGDSPESTSISAFSSTASSRPTSATTATAAPSITPSLSSGGSSNSKAGAIAGGVVGGLAFLCVLAASIFWFIHRRRARKSTRPSSPILSDSHSVGMSTTPIPYTYQPTASSTPPPPRPYDPSDPTTYPDLETQSALNSSPYQSMSQRQSRVVYSGAAEI